MRIRALTNETVNTCKRQATYQFRRRRRRRLWRLLVIHIDRFAQILAGVTAACVHLLRAAAAAATRGRHELHVGEWRARGRRR